MKNFNLISSKWFHLGLMSLALSSTLSITPSKEAYEQRVFSLSPAEEQDQEKRNAEKITGTLRTLNNQDHFTNATPEVKRIEIPTENGKLHVLLEKSQKNGQILAVVPWDQTEGDVCIDNTCSDRKTFQLDSLFSDLKNKNETDLQIEILKYIKKSKQSKPESAKTEPKVDTKKDEKIDVAIRENILPPKKTDLSAGGKLLAAAVKDCDSEDYKLSCLNERFIEILRGDHKPSIAESINFYKNYMEGELLDQLTEDDKPSWYSRFTNDSSDLQKKHRKGMAIIEELLKKIPAGFLPLREAVVYTQEKSIQKAANQYVHKFSNAKSDRDLYSAHEYFNNVVLPLKFNNPSVLYNGLNYAQQRDFISLGLANSLRTHYDQYATGLWKSFDQYFANPRSQQSWLEQIAKPLPELDLNKYQVPVDYKTIQLLPAVTSLVPAASAQIHVIPPATSGTSGPGRQFGRGL